jgi:hypothetical protein
VLRTVRLALTAWARRAPGWPPPGSDLVGYEVLVKFIRRHGLHRLPGDFVEIGAFLGGGTYKLARLARECGELVWVVDIFDPSFDTTQNLAGFRMCELYQRHLAGRSQECIFYEVNKKNLEYLRVLKSDSKQVKFPTGVRFAFGFIDGNHDPAYVENDFYLVWEKLVPGGAVGFHDYKGDRPQVTAKIEELIRRERLNIAGVVEIPAKWIVLLIKKGHGSES